ncbi:nucleotide exchange factor GrpE [Chlamydiifrater volucris]|uniref:nucleotide exchange factor GrpE n=1 Tax=Chlamydiifrater volucris TaxID=2681470 RepID=UPI001BCFCE64|nr:nucleotide exchange factor GrpE [Chlamydiifrater volucris]
MSETVQESDLSKEDDELSSLRKEVEQLKTEVEEKNTKYLMALAEAENSRKRMQKERQELTRYAVENAIIEFLGPIENMEKALTFAQQGASDEVRNWATGFQMILDQLKLVFTDKGITEYSSLGQKFDPFLHEAVETEETNEHPEGTILEEFSKGYKVGDRPVRVARVKVAKPVVSTETDENKKENN